MTKIKGSIAIGFTDKHWEEFTQVIEVNFSLDKFTEKDYIEYEFVTALPDKYDRDDVCFHKLLWYKEV